ncbi:hypothetical protein HPB47_014584 [Ixodes persulcatus]|uniref:Uncharacterized protein n=1 Tax=Ixodes persulcatus TaxID=34615 RepID=A0AC60QX06_IXOPE|nr:hypothetical protein HPB47_014584 [Ixodes persulcatus]
MNKPKKFFSDNEKALLAELVSKYKLIESKGTNKATAEVKAAAWAALTVEFNSIHGFYKRDEAQLRKCWDNLKTKWKKEKAVENQNRIATGGGPPGAGMSQLSVLVGAAAPHMARRVQNNTDSDGRLADQPLFTVAQILEPMVLPQADDLSLDCIPDYPMDHEEDEAFEPPAAVVPPAPVVRPAAPVRREAARPAAAAWEERVSSSAVPQAVPARSGGRFGVLERTMGAEQDVRLGYLRRDQERKEEEHAFRLTYLKKELEMKVREHKLRMRKLRSENQLLILQIAEKKK